MAEHSDQNRVIVDNLNRIPFFKGLPSDTLAAISARLHFVELEHGDVVFEEDGLGHSMYLIESGQVKVSVNVSKGQEKVISFLGPGNFFGEMALILDQRRTATVTVSIDADLWVLHKTDLDDILVEYPQVALQITKELSRRLSNTFTETSKRSGYRITSVFGVDVWKVAESVYKLTNQRVVLFDATGQNLAGRISPDKQNEKLVVLEAMDNLSDDTFSETLGILADGYDWVLVALSTEYSEVNKKALKISGAIVLCNTPLQDWMSDSCPGPVFRCDNSQTEIDRAARKITHRVVGLALSSGGARGIAHIGVIETLENNNIPIDMIAGTSAGSLFGGLYAAGKSVYEIAEFAENLIKLTGFKSGLWDPKFKLPWNGLIKGNATLKYLDKQFDHATFADTKIPFYVVATDVMSGEEVVFKEGKLANAVRASIGMIGIFSPYQLDDHYLIDGGAVNPVPASVLAENGANIIIASSVIPSIEEERARERAHTSNQQPNPNFLGVLNSMMAIMEREIVKTRMTSVDVLIKPKVAVYSAMDYDKADEFLHLGREATNTELSQIQALFSN